METKSVMDQVTMAIEVARVSKVPVLFASNPGYGKTTTAELWAKAHGYSVQRLIGSAQERSDVLGYLVNTDKPYLEHKMPQWFWQILQDEKAGKPTLLFIDELSTAPSDVQATLFRLINEREIADGTKLPESTIIISAANYKDNLSGFNGIEAPAVNRFSIINVEPDSFDAAIDEYINDEIPELPVYHDVEFTNRKELIAGLKDLMHNVSGIYTNDKDSTKGHLDVHNRNFSDVYESDYTKNKYLYNFISGRSLSCLTKCLIAICSLDIDRDYYIEKLIPGLIGLGFNSFDNPDAVNKFNNYIIKNVRKLVNKVVSGKANYAAKAEKKEAVTAGKPTTVVEAITKIQQKQDSFETVTKEDFADAVTLVLQEFPTDVTSSKFFTNNKAANIKLGADLRALPELVEMLKFVNDPSSDAAVTMIETIIENYNGYRKMVA